MEQLVTCPNGHQNPPDQRFCGACGAPVGATAEEVVASTPEGAAPAEGTVASPAPARRGSNRLILLGAGVAIIVIGLLGWLVLTSRGGVTGPLAEKHTINGSLSASDCGGGYDIENAAVEVRDEKDKVIGAGTTGSDIGGGGVLCIVEFTIPDVPKASFYQVTIGTHGGPSYSYEEMKSSGWRLDLSLG